MTQPLSSNRRQDRHGDTVSTCWVFWGYIPGLHTSCSVAEALLRRIAVAYTDLQALGGQEGDMHNT